MRRQRIPSNTMKRQMRTTSSNLKRIPLVLLLVFSAIISSTMLLVGQVEAVLPHYAMDIFARTAASQRYSSGSTATITETLHISTMLLSHAYFGAPLPMKNDLKTPEQLESFTLSYPPDETNALLCDDTAYSASYIANTMPKNKFVMLVPRGECTFETKAYHAQLLGASAVIIYGTLASRYTYNTSATNVTITTTSSSSSFNDFLNPDMIYPKSKHDYDCQYGKALIPVSQASQSGLTLNPTYNPYKNDPLLSSVIVSSSTITTWEVDGSSADTNLCRLYDTATSKLPNESQKRSPSFQTHCASQQCLLTRNIVSTTTTVVDDDTNFIEACCAWDLPIWLYPDTIAKNYTVTIPVAYMTTQQMSELKEMIMGYAESTTIAPTEIVVQLYQRWRPKYNYSAICIWLLGCMIATIAAYYSANEYHSATQYYYMKRRLRQASSRTTATTNDTPETTAAAATSTTTQQPHHHHQNQPEEVLELTAMHAIGFVIMASTSLMVLFYFKIYSIVKIMYAFGCSTAVAQVIFVPVYDYVVSPHYRNIIVYRTNTEDFGDITVKDIVTHVCGFSCGISWLMISFLYHNAEEIIYYWVMQDVFGACMCITFLKVIRLNSIRVASILLIVAFFYDIFFVFITPHLFHGKSVMITVATSGGPPKADALWCEKYPYDKDCQGGNPLPMLLAIPKLFDYTGGSSLLGLGDIVLPGLLLSFAARFDAAKILVGVLGGGRPSNQSYSCPEQQCCNNMLPSRCGTILCSGGYFGPLIVAYAIGLAMANTAVYVMHMGQPALLYLVPCCLGTVIYIGYRRGELTQLWDGPRVLQTADNILYNNNNNGNESGDRSGQEPQPISNSNNNNNNNLHAPIPMDEEGYGNDALAVAPPSAVDDDNDN